VLRFSCRYFDELFSSEPGEVRGRVVSHVCDALGACAATQKASIQDMATTLLVVAVKGSRFLAVHVGDGVIACERDGVSSVLSSPTRGEYANETVFITSRKAPDALFLARGDVRPYTAFALMSDGSATVLYDRRESRIAPAVRTIWGWLDRNTPSDVESALRHNLRDLFLEKSSDDCSLAIMRRRVTQIAAIAECDLEFQKLILGCTSSRSVRSRLSVLRCMEEEDYSVEPDALATIAKKTGLSIERASFHAFSMRQMLS
jgi:hypothetical protein